MRKITSIATSKFITSQNFKLANTEVFIQNGCTKLALHGNTIAKHREGVVQITTAGWRTRTTFERLNGIPGVRVNTKKGELYLNGEVWNGSWIQIN